MLEIDPRSPVAINDQIKAGLRGLVAKGLLRSGDQAPPIRSLAVALKVNPNTVARAFRELSLEGFLESRRGGGNHIAAGARRQAKNGLDELRCDLREAIEQSRRGGLAWPDIETVVERTRREEV